MSVPMFVYFITNNSGAVKIGIASDAKKRLRELNCAVGSPHGLTLIGTVLFPDRSQAQRAETYLHRTFASIRIRGEWFSETPGLMEFIATSLVNGIDLPAVSPRRPSPRDLVPPVSIRFEKSQFEALQKLASEERRPIGEMVRVLIDEARASRNRRRTRNQEQAA